MNLKLYSTIHGLFYSLTNDIVFVNHLERGTVFEEDLILNTLIPRLKKYKPKDTYILLDIGSHIGSHSILYSTYLPNSQIYSFEPQKTLYTILNKNIEINNRSNIKTYHNAVGHISCKCHMSDMLYDGYNLKINYETSQSFNYGGITIGSNGEEVTMIRIDDLKLEGCDYIKIDVEGCESLVLHGAIETIRKYKPIIFFEYSDKYLNMNICNELKIKHSTFATPIDFLKNEDYRIESYKDCNYLAIYEKPNKE